MATSPEARSIGELLRDLASDSASLVQQEFALARAEAEAKLHQMIMAAIELLVGALVAFAALIILLDAVVYSLAEAGQRQHDAFNVRAQAHAWRLASVEPEQGRRELPEVGAQVDTFDLARSVELVVDQAERLDPACDGEQLAPRLPASGPALLQANEARDHLQVVLDPVLQFTQQPLLVGNGRSQFAQGAGALDRVSQQVGISAQELGVIVSEAARLAAVDLEDAEGWLAGRAGDRDVDQGLDPVIDQKAGDLEALLLCKIGRDYGLVGLQARTLSRYPLRW